jgi:hypothetical protein
VVVLEPVVALTRVVELPQGVALSHSLLALELQRQPRRPVEQLRRLEELRLA